MAEQENTPETAEQQKPVNKVKRTTNAILALVFVSIGTAVVSDRIIPTTDNVRVEGNVVSLIPEVSGPIDTVLVEPNKVVKKGTVLAKIAPIDYQIALKKAETKVKLTGQNVGAQMADVMAAQAQLTNAVVALDNAKRQGQRLLSLADRGIVSKSDADNTRAALQTAKADVAKARANLERAKTQVGANGEDNAQMQTALLELQQAQLNVERTILRAPTDGSVTNFKLTEGAYAKAGQSLLTFVSSDNLWIEANFRENSLGNIKQGNKVEVALDFAPGKTYSGRVVSVDLGAAWGVADQPGALASVTKQNGWLRDSQRMPVTIQLDDADATEYMRIGGQADVVVYTDESSLMNMLGKAWIRLVSLFSYVR
ncbi:HlyD family secretion protein [Vibrio breoganii]|uniref:Secretion protein n=1 Tax=Vibrio breoganii TaxID=553239 RepID=A0AAP8MTM0_9VIBR|nr:HlyD family secretion protein [Vibrio breoganii]NMO74906.1 HlyD family secretion protein [Vibrio breoganii]NMR71407.1 HlyD family secretion protein [Vibrio breoganii]OED94269.1 secretion protein [Vibrio breoganii ZF-29]PMG76108.1 secretion protein [Vibrio breoganii]PML85373.1 secretion protein [Vibrio breoganii]